MADINTITLSGRLTKDSELTYTESNVAMLRFSIVNNRKIKKNNEWTDYVQYFDSIVFSRKAEILSKYLKKGTSVVVSGSLKYNSWTDKNNNKRTKISILTEDIKFFNNNNNSTLNNTKNTLSASSDEFKEDIPF